MCGPSGMSPTTRPRVPAATPVRPSGPGTRGRQPLGTVTRVGGAGGTPESSEGVGGWGQAPGLQVGLVEHAHGHVCSQLTASSHAWCVSMTALGLCRGVAVLGGLHGQHPAHREAGHRPRLRPWRSSVCTCSRLRGPQRHGHPGRSRSHLSPLESQQLGLGRRGPAGVPARTGAAMAGGLRGSAERARPPVPLLTA